MSLQPSLFARLTVVEDELSAVKSMLAELQVSQDELRHDRDEWRWRAERLLADLQRGTWWRWCNRAAACYARCHRKVYRSACPCAELARRFESEPGRVRLRPLAGRPRRTRSHSAEHHAQIVCGHFGDHRSRESNGLRDRGNRFEVSQTPVRVAIAKAPVEGLIARRRFEPFAFVWTVEIQRRLRREYRGGPLDQSQRRLPR